MTEKLIECVPNISEGRDRAIIDAVAAVVAEVEGVRLLDVDPGRGDEPHRHHLHRPARGRRRGGLPRRRAAPAS